MLSPKRINAWMIKQNIANKILCSIYTGPAVSGDTAACALADENQGMYVESTQRPGIIMQASPWGKALGSRQDQGGPLSGNS